MVKAIYAGTFDPVTYGHLDIIHRAHAIFDNLVVASTEPANKSPLFSLEERLDLISRSLGDNSQIEITSFSGLLVDYARASGAQVLVRGLRAASDFEFEFEMSMMNRKLAPDIETMFLVTRPEYMFVSSSLIREIARGGGEISYFVPEIVQDAIINRLNRP